METADFPLVARVTKLEMLALPAHRVAMPTGPKLAVLRAPFMPLSFYRYLYEQVGKPHHWLWRRNMGDEELAAIIHAETTEISVLYVDGSPAGFCELDFSELPQEAEIVYFGLTPEFQGRGLAKFFLSEAIFSCWTQEPKRVVIQTNTLDSPRALQLYQRMGFAPYAWTEENVVAWK